MREVIRQSRWKIVGLVPFGVMFAGGGLQTVYERGNLFGWPIVLLGGWLALAALCQMIFPARLILTGEGMQLRGAGEKNFDLRWRELEQFVFIEDEPGKVVIGFHVIPEVRSPYADMELDVDRTLPGGFPGTPRDFVDRILQFRAEALTEASIVQLPPRNRPPDRTRWWKLVTGESAVEHLRGARRDVGRRQLR